MAKFSRYDARNKKKNRKKQMSQEKDLRIKKLTKKSGLHFKKNMLEYSYNEGE